MSTENETIVMVKCPKCGGQVERTWHVPGVLTEQQDPETGKWDCDWDTDIEILQAQDDPKYYCPECYHDWEVPYEEQG